ncbi:MAG: conjugative transfer signal peptidase TraF, partial [Alphaproteobacteria bacterium]|nr:conjugative transfer signal peptidase TraF [Alphaproteobacteria bacterium]
CITDKEVDKNSYVIFCPPAEPIFLEAKKRGYLTTGFCEGELGYMMKKVLAAKNDSVSFEREGVRVNGDLLPLTARAVADKHGREMPAPQPGVKTLGESDFLVMSDVNPKSFDSRYFGVVNRKQIKSVITPVFTW